MCDSKQVLSCHAASAAESSAAPLHNILRFFHLPSSMTLSLPSHIRLHYTSSLIFPLGSIKYSCLILLHPSRISHNLTLIAFSYCLFISLSDFGVVSSRGVVCFFSYLDVVWSHTLSNIFCGKEKDMCKETIFEMLD